MYDFLSVKLAKPFILYIFKNFNIKKIMKKLFLLFIYFILLSSCKSALISTHSEVMDKYKTERQVATRFGLPDREVTSNGIKQWTYDYGTVSRTSTYNPAQTGTGSCGMMEMDL